MAFRFVLFTSLGMAFSLSAHAMTFSDEFERDFPIRSFGELQVTNLRGGIEIKGWSHDKIRVKARRKVEASTQEEANRQIAALDVRFSTVGMGLELSAEYGKNLSIEERLRERKMPKTSMDLVIFAPAALDLRVWTVDGKVLVREWGHSVEVRSARGAVRVENVRSKKVSVLCPSCDIAVSKARGSVRCMGGTGDVSLNEINADDVFVETQSGSISSKQVSGRQLYVSRAGALVGHRLTGHVEFHTTSGPVRIDELSGFASGRTQDGPIELKIRSWSFIDKALFESNRGRIRLEFPRNFSAEIDLWSLYGKARLDFGLTPAKDFGVFGPEPKNHLRGTIGEGGEQLRAFSQEGDVALVPWGKT
jgi:hypothetical protein